MNDAAHYDVIIAGAGLAGASLALALGTQGLRVALIEAIARPTSQQTGFDERSITLSYGSAKIFAGLGLWPRIANHATPIHHIHISERGRFGATRLSSRDEGVDALGYVVNARLLGGTLIDALDTLPAVTWICPAHLSAIEASAAGMRATIDRDGTIQTLDARLLVGADGADSTVRRLLNIGVTAYDYAQSAIVTQVSVGAAHANTAYERFTDGGAIALLPIAPQRMGLVWMLESESARAALAWNDAEFLTQLQQQFGTRLGRLHDVAARRSYPLRLLRAKEQHRARALLIGNAAHTLHPIGGQGFNLGLRDIAALAQLIVDARRDAADIGSTELLERYRAWREADQTRVVRFTDGLVRVFESTFAPLAAVRPLGFLAATLCPPLKHRIARGAMGLAGQQSKLARGLPL